MLCAMGRVAGRTNHAVTAQGRDRDRIGDRYWASDRDLYGARGAAVTIDYIGKPDNARQVVGQIEQGGGKALAVEANIADLDQVKLLVARTVQIFGRLDIMVNNAGIEEKHPFLEAPFALWRTIITVNLTGPWLCSQVAARQMVTQGNGGRIINISSAHEDMAMPTNAPYCAAKGGLRMLMRTIAVELAPHKITVNNIGPGAIDTPMDAPLKAHPDQMKTLLSEIPLGRMGQPEEVAELAIYLASDAAAYVTGSTYFIDGGMLRQSGSL
ncbi:MAG TPA: SDR family oxidoreductase [Chloroflexota bacterium]|nr:SDR family oxidoreductase [Chloroflexota bacterium]